MPTITVTAPDSAQAMDEIARCLGDGAFILSTSSKEGQIEIRATNDPMRMSSAKGAGQDKGKTKFETLFARIGNTEEHVVLNHKKVDHLKPTKPTQLEGLTAESAATDVASINMLDAAGDTAPIAPQPSAITVTPEIEPETPEPQKVEFETASPHPKTMSEALSSLSVMLEHTQKLVSSQDTEKADLQLKADRAAARAEIAKERAEIAREEADRAENEAAKLRRDIAVLNDELRTALKKAEQTAMRGTATADHGFSTDLIQRLQGTPTLTNPETFTRALANEITTKNPMALLNRSAVIIAGPSGTGKTVLAAKFAKLAAGVDPEAHIQLVSLSGNGLQTPLCELAHQQGVDFAHWSPDHMPTADDVDLSTRYIIDLDTDLTDISDNVSKLETLLGIGTLPVVVAMPGGQSPDRIRASFANLSGLETQVALTKLDECECDAREISAYAEVGTAIAWLSGTRELQDTLAPASADLLRDYLTSLLPAELVETPAMAAE